MVTDLSERRIATPAAETGRRLRRRTSWWIAVVGLAIVLAVNLPLFVCMPLDTDATFYDVCARSLLRHGVEYRDAMEHGLPGMTWLQTGVRSLVGWRSEALRLVDLVVVGAVAWLLFGWLRSVGRSQTTAFWAVLVLSVFYFGISEWNHCQRDVWMLLPALGALRLRARQLERFELEESDRLAVVRNALLEGLLWGIAFWIKPFVAVQALCCWTFGVMRTLRLARRSGSRLALDFLGLVAGGALIGAIGVARLVLSGGWPYFRDVMLNWNPEYNEFARASGWTFERLSEMYRDLFPWVLVHVLAVPMAIYLLIRGLRRPRQLGAPAATRTLRQALLAALYLGWLLQAWWQNLLEYIQIPPIILGLAVVAAAEQPLRDRLLRSLTARARRPISLRSVRFDRRVWLCLWVGFAAVALSRHPMFEPGRLALWGRCFSEGSSPEIRDGLALTDHVDWQDLFQIEKAIKLFAKTDGYVTCYSNGTQAIYSELNLKPSTRFVYLDTYLAAFPRHREQILKELMNSNQGYVVTDLRTLGFWRLRRTHDSLGMILSPELAYPKDKPIEFPWNEPVVIHSGSYFIQRVTKR